MSLSKCRSWYTRKIVVTSQNLQVVLNSRRWRKYESLGTKFCWCMPQYYPVLCCSEAVVWKVSIEDGRVKITVFALSSSADQLYSPSGGKYRIPTWIQRGPVCGMSLSAPSGEASKLFSENGESYNSSRVQFPTISQSHFLKFLLNTWGVFFNMKKRLKDVFCDRSG